MAKSRSQADGPTAEERKRASSAPELSSAGDADEVGFEVVPQGPKCRTCGDTRVVSRLRFPEAKPAPGYHDTMGSARTVRRTHNVVDVVEQRDEADEGRLEARRGTVVGRYLGWPAIVSGGAGARPSQLIASVRWTSSRWRGMVSLFRRRRWLGTPGRTVVDSRPASYVPSSCFRRMPSLDWWSIFA
jgi:hypothetical protein